MTDIFSLHGWWRTS
ncbi:trp operon leader peptide [Cronobacter universalis]|nr:trp operon leader peptide [Cronobacter universalis]